MTIYALNAVTLPNQMNGQSRKLRVSIADRRSKMTDKEKIKSAYDMTDEEVAKSVDLDVSDFDDSGDMLDELRDIMEGE